MSVFVPLHRSAAQNYNDGTYGSGSYNSGDVATSVPTSTVGSISSGGYITYGCKDLKATNYNYFSTSNPALCQYATTSTVQATTTFTFTKNLTLGQSDSQVRLLQQYLNTHGFTVSKIGSGSSGSETTMFGSATKAALIKFQKARGITPASGYFGRITKLNIGAY